MGKFFKISSPLYLPKTIMLPYRLPDLPGAGHAVGEGDEVAGLDGDRLAAVGCDHHFAFQDVAGLIAVIGPGEGGHVVFPDGPVEHAHLFKLRSVRIALQLDLAHRSPPLLSFSAS